MRTKIYVTLAFILTSSISAIAQVPAYVPTNGLVGYWPFNGNASDVSGNGNNGVNYGASLTKDRFNNLGSAFEFDGVNNYISVPHSSDLNISVPFSISIWIKVDEYPNDGNEHYFISKFSGGPGNSMQGFHAAFSDWVNSDFVFWRYRNNNSSNWGGVSTQYSDLPSLGNWFNLVFIANGTNDLIYVNGILRNSSNSAICGSNSVPLLFGKDYNYSSASRNFKGALDDVGIWSRALTEVEVLSLYTGCSDTVITSEPNDVIGNIGNNAQFNALARAGSLYQWQSNANFLGWQNIPTNTYYFGSNTNTLSVNNVSVSNHNQAFRMVVDAGGCKDTSTIVYLRVTDTCITSVTDTLIINATLTGLTPPNNLNTLRVFPNPANTHITIDYGNFTSMNGYTLKIVNSIGQTVYTTQINQQTSYIDLSTWTGNGIYYLQLIDPTNKTVENRKIVIQ